MEKVTQQKPVPLSTLNRGEMFTLRPYSYASNTSIWVKWNTRKNGNVVCFNVYNCDYEKVLTKDTLVFTHGVIER